MRVSPHVFIALVNAKGHTPLTWGKNTFERETFERERYVRERNVRERNVRERILTTAADRRAKTVESRGREAAVKKRIQKTPRPTPLTGREHVGGGNRGKSPDPAPRRWQSCSGVRGDLREFATACCSAASVLRRAKS